MFLELLHSLHPVGSGSTIWSTVVRSSSSSTMSPFLSFIFIEALALLNISELNEGMVLVFLFTFTVFTEIEVWAGWTLKSQSENWIHSASVASYTIMNCLWCLLLELNFLLNNFLWFTDHTNILQVACIGAYWADPRLLLYLINLLDIDLDGLLFVLFDKNLEVFLNLNWDFITILVLVREVEVSWDIFETLLDEVLKLLEWWVLFSVEVDFLVVNDFQVWHFI